MRSTRVLVALVAAGLLSSVLLSPRHGTVQAAAPTKKTCKMVTKKVHGKKQKVKVCKAAKPKATATPEPTNTPAPTATPSGTPTSPQPLSVTVHLSNTGAVTQTIGSNGGTLSTTDRRGTSFTLQIPAHALQSPLAITMTPIDSIDGLPLSKGLLGAVQLGPDGTTFAQPLTLTITSTQPLNGGMPVAFGYHGSGAEFHLQPSTANGTTVTISLVHFSGAGAGSGTQGDVNAQLQHPPTSPADQADQAAAAAKTTSAVFGVEDGYYRSTLRAELQAAVANPDSAQGAIEDYGRWALRIKIEVIQFSGLDAKLASDLQEAEGLAQQAFYAELQHIGSQCSDRSLVYLDAAAWPAGMVGWGHDLVGSARFVAWYNLGVVSLGHFEWTRALTPEAVKDFQPCRPKGFKFAELKLTGQDKDDTPAERTPEEDNGGIVTFEASGYVCGEDPYAKPWDVTWLVTQMADDNIAPEQTIPPLHDPTLLNPNSPTWARSPAPFEGENIASLQLLPSGGPSNSPQMKGHFAGETKIEDWVDIGGDQTVPMIEDTADCQSARP